MKLRRFYQQVLFQYPVLTLEQERGLFKEYGTIQNETERKKSADRIANSNLRLVLTITRRICSNYPDSFIFLMTWFKREI